MSTPSNSRIDELREDVRHKEEEEEGHDDDDEEEEKEQVNNPVNSVGRRNLGRKARKRRKKYQEIVAAATPASTGGSNNHISVSSSSSSSKAGPLATPLGTINTHSVTTTTTTNNNNNTNNNTILPTDRGYVWDAVRNLSTLSNDDEQDLVRQLGYLPGNALQVVARVGDVFPIDCFCIPPPPPSNGSDNNNDNVTIERIMREPLVLKLYPLVIRDVTNGTKSRRKRKGGNRDLSSGKVDVVDMNHQEDGTTSNESPSASHIAPAPPLEVCDEKRQCVDTNIVNSASATSMAGSERAPDPPQQSHTEEQSILLEPFPTIYWVTHPLIKAEISKLELERVGSEFEQRLMKADSEATAGYSIANTSSVPPNDNNIDNNNVANRMRRAHIAYGTERCSLITTSDWTNIIRRKKWENAFSSTQRGVAGIRNPLSVKCLHAHAAHYWSNNNNDDGNDNVVGMWVSERIIERMKKEKKQKTPQPPTTT